MQLKYNYAIWFLFLNISLLGRLQAQASKWRTTIDFGEKYYFVQDLTKQWGLCTKDNKLVIATKYDTIFPLSIVKFDPNTFSMKKTPTKYVIAKQGDLQTLFTISGKPHLVVNGIMPRLMGDVVLVRKDKHWGLAKTSGTFLLPLECSAIEWYGDVLGLQYKKKWLLFDPNKGQLFEEMEYDKIIEVTTKSSNPRKQLLLIKQHNKWGVLDEKMQLVVPIKYDEIKVDSNNFICKEGNKIIRLEL